jgi:D-beta-D-heptose 7-phosphate kinase/D-beta-D-heptose 1-phosphate adenosyltransferase
MNIWTNGCFDILHIGHIELFKYAKSLGHKLIVGIDSDQRIKNNKGSNRPVNTELDRKNFLESIRYIDEVYIFNTDDELRSLLLKNNINLIIVGDDYSNKYVIGSEYCSVIFFEKVQNYSTSRIINEIQRTRTN